MNVGCGGGAGPGRAFGPAAPGCLTRREFLWMLSMSAAGAAAGCAFDPVTGRSQLMLVSEAQEIQIDRQYSPRQYSADYGLTQDAALNRYIDGVGRSLIPHTHRPGMPYAFRTVNAVYVNAYAFPGGSIAVTRGILLELANEASLAALLGHELGHVNARHTAEQMSKSQMTSVLLSGLQLAAGMGGASYGDIAGQLGMLGASLLLASYSRDNEREADALGNAYMVKAGYNTDGFVDLMGMLNSLSKEKPGYADVLFSTHPMSDERYRTAVNDARTKYQASHNAPLGKERYMDQTASLRRMKGAIELMQKGDASLSRKRYDEAESFFRNALEQAPRDYAALVMMSKCLIVQEKSREALRYADQARAVYPGEAQAYYVSGFARLDQKQFQEAFQAFDRYDQILPGNPSTAFLKGYALEGMGRKPDAAAQYQKYLQSVQKGAQAQHAYNRLVEWGYIRK
ncbi:M48 family metalloprotease [Desulfococcus sp.]|uniref:M48 family metalloprotease n=1 Tax=Desulfococcus sp. TaxID=2025834 RepID=UPI003593D9D5